MATTDATETATKTDANPPVSPPAAISATDTETKTETVTNPPVSSPPAAEIVVGFGGENAVGAADSGGADPKMKALDELKQLLVSAIANNEFAPPVPPSVLPAASENPPKSAVIDDKTVTVDDNGVKTMETIEESKETINLQPQSPEKPINALPEETTKAPALPSPAPQESVNSQTSEFSAPPEEIVKEAPLEPAEAPKEEVLIWGVPLVGDERSDTVLLKFLQAREFKAREAFDMIKDCITWRRQFGVEELLSEELGFPEMDKVVFMDGVDREGHPVCYNVYGDFQNAEFYEKAFGDVEKRQRFIRWRIRYLEKGIRELLDFRPGGVNSMVQVTDFKNAPQFGKHRTVASQIVALLQDNYPEFIAKKIFINVPWWNLAAFWMMNLFTQRTKSKFVFAGPSKSAETLFKYIAPEQVPVAYGGLSKEKNREFATSDAVKVVTIKPLSKHSIEIPATEESIVVWELRVIDWDVTYGAEFVPSAENAYSLIVQKPRKFAKTDEPVIKNSFKFSQPGLLALNIENQTSKNKLLLYRFKVKSSTE